MITHDFSFAAKHELYGELIQNMHSPLQTGSADEPYKVVLPRLTPVPTRRQHKFVLQPEQTAFCLNVLQATPASGGEQQPQKIARVRRLA